MYPPRRHPLAKAAVALSTSLGVSALALVGARTVHADDFMVDTISDNPADGYTLREAINDANLLGGIDNITFAPGLTGTIALTAQLDIVDSVRIVGPGSGQLILDGGDAHRVIHSMTPGTELAMEGLTIANGATAGPGGGIVFHDGQSLVLDDVAIVDNESSSRGGGISIDSVTGSIDFTDVVIAGNTSTEVGGGVAGEGIAGVVDLERVEITGNQSAAASGGGGGFIDVVGNITFDDVTVEGNTAATEIGGIAVAGTGNATIADLSVIENIATGDSYGGLFLDVDGTVDIDGLELVRNDSHPMLGAFGGGLVSSSTSNVTVRNALVDDNGAGAYGGLAVSAMQHLEVIDTTISNNASSTSVSGLLAGALLGVELTRVTSLENMNGSSPVALSSDNDIVVAESTFANSTSTGAGGGLQIETSGDDVFIRNSTISGNSADDGAIAITNTNLYIEHSTIVDNVAAGDDGAVATSGVSTVEYDHSIVAGNTGTLRNDASLSLAAVDYSLVEDTTGVLIAAGSNIIGVDPDLGPLADTGGPTMTHLPASTSQALEAGDPALAFPLVDQRGGARVVGVVDIGSVERTPADTPPPEPPAPPAEPPTPADLTEPVWLPLDPARIVETREGFDTVDGELAGIGQRPADSTLIVEVAGRAGVPADARGVIVNMTAVRPTSGGFGTIHPCLADLPNTSSLNFTTDVNLGNEVIAELDDAGRLCVYTEVATDLTLDIVGYIPADSPYTSTTPARFADTRDGGASFDGAVVGGGKPGAGDVLTIPVAGRGDVPADAAAVVMYVSAVKPESTGFVTAFGCEHAMPNASSLNYATDVNRGNEIIVRPDSNGDICLFTDFAAHLTADVVGYLPAGTDYEALPTGARLLDTRAGRATVDGDFAGIGRRTDGSIIAVPIAGRGGIPADATTAVLNMTAIKAAGVGYATAFDCDGAPPLASSLNYLDGVNGGNEIIVGLSDVGSVCVFVETDTDLTIDAAGSTTLAG